MRPLKWVVLSMAVVAVTGTWVAAQSGAFDRATDMVETVVEGFSAEAGHAVDQGVRAGQSAADFRWAGRLDAGSSLEIKGINGSITVVAASGDEIVVTAESRGRRSDPGSVRIERVEHRGGLTFCAVYPTPEGKRENFCGAGDDGRMSTQDNDVQVDFQIEVPDGVDFIGRTVNGDVEAWDVGGDVRAVTVNGDIEISTAGFAEAETVNGSIDATMGSRELRGGATFSTINGSITLDLDDDVDADLDASWLNGGFESDLPFALQGRMTRRSARGMLGDGGPELSLSTVNGSIRLR